MSNVALVVRTSYHDYEDVMTQETLYEDGQATITLHEFMVSDIENWLGEDQAILYFDEENEQASLALLLGLTDNVHRYFGDTHIYLNNPYRYDDLTWDFLVTYASEMDLTYRDEE